MQHAAHIAPCTTQSNPFQTWFGIIVLLVLVGYWIILLAPFVSDQDIHIVSPQQRMKIYFILTVVYYWPFSKPFRFILNKIRHKVYKQI